MSIPEKWAIFPLHEILRAEYGTVSCTCDLGAHCKSIGKHPAALYTTLEPGQVFLADEGTGNGVCTGREFNLWVLDLDVKPYRPAEGNQPERPAVNGPAEMAKLEAIHGKLPRTYTVGRGEGRHFYFTWPEGVDYLKNSGNEIGKGVDVRGYRGFVAAEGSPHKSGMTYEAVDDTTWDDVVAAPDWLVKLVRATERQLPTSFISSVKTVDIASAEGQRRLRMGLELCKTAPIASEGAGGSTQTFEIAMELGRRLELPYEAVWALMSEVYNPRCQPPWPDDQLARKIDQGINEGNLPAGITTLSMQEVLDRAKAATKEAAAIKAITPDTPVAAPRTRRLLPDPDHRYVADRPHVEIEAEEAQLSAVVHELDNHAHWQGVLQYDMFAKRMRAVNPPMPLEMAKGNLEESDISHMRLWFERHLHMRVGKEMMYNAIDVVGRKNSYHPIKEYLFSLPAVPAGPKLLDNLAAIFWGDESEIAQVLVRKWLVAAVRRILVPGTKVDNMLVLQGEQDLHKSSGPKVLFGGSAWFNDQMPELDSKDASVQLSGQWCVELAEMHSIIKSENQTTKAFLSRSTDKYRPPYGRTVCEYERECVFIGTTNDKTVLTDPTGARRFWPINVSKKTPWIVFERLRDRIWAEALEIALRPHTQEDAHENWHWLTASEGKLLETQQAPFQEVDPWHEQIEDMCRAEEAVRVRDIYLAITGQATTEKLDKKVEMRIGDTLKRLGCVSQNLRDKKTGTRFRSWAVPSDLQDTAPSREERQRRLALAQTRVGNNIGQPKP